MATEVTSIDELNEDEVKEQQTILTQFLQDKYPNTTISYGVMHDLVNYLNAIFSAKERKELENWKTARSLMAIKDNSEGADTECVDNILSNYNVERKTGTKAYGTIQLEMDQNSSFIVRSGTTFTTSGLIFETTSNYLVYEEGSTSTVADRILVKLSSGNYGCSIPVVSREVGSNQCIKKGKNLVCDINNCVAAYALDDFTGGSDAETNDQLIARLKTGIATPCWGNRENIKAILFNSDKLPAIIDASIIGFADEEMTRDQLTIFPVSTGGKADIYVKSAPYTTTKTIRLQATVYNKDMAESMWTMTISGAYTHGMWRVVGVKPANSSDLTNSYEILEQTVTSTKEDLKDIDACYTIYQDITVKFKTINSDKNKEIGDTDYFDVTLFGLDYIKAATEIITDRSIVPVTADVIVKAAVPCIVSAEIKLKYNINNTISDDTINNIKIDLASLINNKQFTSYLTAAELAVKINERLSLGQNIASIQLTGIILGPGNVIDRIVSHKQLEIPNLPFQYISPKTTAFFSDTSYIDIVTEEVNE